MKPEEITDEMVERACVEQYGETYWRVSVYDPARAVFVQDARRKARKTLTAALTEPPDEVETLVSELMGVWRGDTERTVESAWRGIARHVLVNFVPREKHERLRKAAENALHVAQIGGVLGKAGAEALRAALGEG